MFTGIVTDVGRVRDVRDTARDRRFEIETRFDVAAIEIGASICHSGCCLTVVEKGLDWFAVEASAETLSTTTLATWSVGHAVNLERAARLGDELGGHLVTGHVDGMAEVLSVTPEGGSHRISLRAPSPLHRFIAAKGSVTVDGVSLTVNSVQDAVFEVNIIPHTWSETTLGRLADGDRVNLEIDILARYVARWRETL
jgi:riboflavin synthase